MLLWRTALSGSDVPASPSAGVQRQSPTHRHEHLPGYPHRSGVYTDLPRGPCGRRVRQRPAATTQRLDHHQHDALLQSHIQYRCVRHARCDHVRGKDFLHPDQGTVSGRQIRHRRVRHHRHARGRKWAQFRRREPRPHPMLCTQDADGVPIHPRRRKRQDLRQPHHDVSGQPSRVRH